MLQMINGRYRVERELGRGGMGCVYLVRDTHRDESTLALKTLLPERVEETYLADFKREFGELAKLGHPNVAKAYDFGRIQDTGEYYFTTEFIKGVELFAGTENVTHDQLVDVTTQLLRGLDFIHSHGLLHNDLKPANVLLASRSDDGNRHRKGDLSRLEAAVYGVAGTVKLIDFGLLSAENVAWNTIRGTPRYVSPERIRCQAADRRSDLYSLGCMLYLLYSRRHAFTSKDSRELLRLHLQSEAVPIRKLRPGIPEPVAELIERLMRKSPDERFANAAEAVRFIGETSPAARRSAPRAKTPEIVAGALLHRNQELDKLQEIYTAAASGESHDLCLVVHGPDGMGKTRLVAEFRTKVQVSDGAFVEIRGQSDRHLPPILDAAVADMRRSGIAGFREVEAMVAATDGNGGSIVDVSNLIEKVVFWYAARLPIVVFVDDFDDASNSVRRLALEIVHAAYERLDRRGTPTKLVLILATSEKPENLREHLPDFGTLQVKSFDADESRVFLERIYGQSGLPDGFASRLTAVSQGVPGLLLELARNVAAEGLVRYNGTRWEFPDSLAGLTLPGSAVDAMVARKQLLGVQPATVLEWLAMCRTKVGADVLGQCSLIEASELGTVLARLVREGFVTIDESQKAKTYAISHRGLQNEIATGLNDERRSIIHQRLAQCLEDSLLEISEGEKAEILAYHWLRSGNVPAFLRFAPAAAEYLQRAGHLEQAMDFQRRIFEGMQDEVTAKKIKSLTRLAEMHEFLWDLEQSKRDLNRVLELGAELLRPADRLSLLRKIATIELARHKYVKAVRVFEEARRCVRDPDARTTLSLDAPEALARFFAGERDAGLSLMHRAEHFLEQVLANLSPDDRRGSAICVASISHLANLLQHLGHLERAAALHRRNVELLATLELRQAVAATRCSLGAVELERARKEASLANLEHARELAKEIGDRRTICRARERLGEYHYHYGSLKNALHVTQLGLEDARQLHNLPATASALRQLGRIYFRAGQTEDARSVQQKALVILRDTDDVLGSCYGRLEVARETLSEYKARGVDELLAEIAGDVSALDLPFPRAMLALLRAEAQLLQSGNPDHALLEEARQIFASSGFARDVIDVHLLECRGACLASSSSDALSILDEIAEPLTAIGSNAQWAEAEFYRALIEIRTQRERAGLDRLRELKSWADENLFPRVAARCTELLTPRPTKR